MLILCGVGRGFVFLLLVGRLRGFGRDLCEFCAVLDAFCFFAFARLIKDKQFLLIWNLKV